MESRLPARETPAAGLGADRAGVFYVGVNLPWLTYGCDFGANAWQPDGGVGRADRLRRLDEIFTRLAGSGLRTVRWFVLCDGRCGIEFDARGTPLGPDRLFFRDFDAGLSAASRHGLFLIPVLFDFLWFARHRRVNGVSLGGHGSLLAAPSRRRPLLDGVVSPIVSRYGREAVIRRWDLFNEPEWATLGYGAFNPITALRPRAMRSLLGDLAARVHGATVQGTTVGLASPRGLRLLRGVPVDELQVHWYDRCGPRLYPPASRSRPVLLGEFPTTGSAASPAEIVAGARRLGYSGALGWSALAADGHSDLAGLERAL